MNPRTIVPALVLGLLLVRATTLVSQDAAPPAAEGMVRLNFPDEVELQALVDYVSQRLDVKILYDKQAFLNKKISLRVPSEIPVSTLEGVLQSALKMQGLLLVDAEVAGWKRIEKSENLNKVAHTGDAKEAIVRFGPVTAVTQVFRLQNADPTQVAMAVKPFLTAQTNTIEIKENGVLIVTDYATTILKVAQLVELFDQPKPNVLLELVPIENQTAQAMEQQLRTLMQAKGKAQGLAIGATTGIEVAHDPRTNQVILIGTRERVAETKALVRTLDAPLGLSTEVYPLRHISPDRIDKLVRELVGSLQADRLYKSAVDTEGNTLIATTTPEIQARIRGLVAKLDTTSAAAQSPIRFYKLKNVTVNEVLDALRALEEGGAVGRGGAAGQPRGAMRPDDPIPGPNRPPVGPVQPMQVLPTPPAYRERSEVPEPFLGPPGPEASLSLSGLPNGARITADIATNSLIVVAEPAVQKMYEELIRTLDRRRPQVLIDVKIVAIDTSDNLSVGVEISGGDRTGSRRLFAFDSFGFSQVNPATGALALLPGLGFNGALIDADSADVVIRGLATHRRAKVISAPRVLVNDNATGVLNSVAEVPFTSVNASQTVATTSFAGFAKAGTSVSVTPHISDNDQLQLEFNVTLNSFTGAGTPGVPPPRQTDEVDSEVTIPDGYTVIVGGLNRRFQSQVVQGVPFLEQIPLLKYAVTNRTRDSQCTSLFVFIRPIILRDDKFKDLKFLSDRDIKGAAIPGNFPSSEPLMIR